MSKIDLTPEMRQRLRNPCPCDNCQIKGFSIGQLTDPKTGYIMQESHTCIETCQILRDWNARRND